MSCRPRVTETWNTCGRVGCPHALESLPEKLRVVLVMSLYQGLKYDEIATVLKIPTERSSPASSWRCVS